MPLDQQPPYLVGALAEYIRQAHEQHPADSKLRQAISQFLDVYGDRDTELPGIVHLITAARQDHSVSGRALAMALPMLEVVSDAADVEWQEHLDVDVLRLPVTSVVGECVLRLMLHTELMLIRMPDMDQERQSLYRFHAARQARVWYYG